MKILQNTVVARKIDADQDDLKDTISSRLDLIQEDENFNENMLMAF